MAMLTRTTLSRAGAAQPELFFESFGGERYFMADSLSKVLDFSNQYQASIASGHGPGTLTSWVDLSPTFETTSDSSTRTLIKGHQFAIVGFNPQTNTFTIYNPWGKRTNSMNDSYISPFEMSAADVYSKYLLPRIGDPDRNLSLEVMSFNS